jgi:lipopolysaccharide export system protein LptA
VIKGGDRIHADNGEYSKDRDEFWFSGNVHVETKDGESLDASEIIFYVSTNSFEALGGVELLFFVGE